MRKAVILFAIGLLVFGLNAGSYAGPLSVSDGGWSITVDTERKIRGDDGWHSEGLVNWEGPSGYDYVYQDSWWGRDSTASSESPLSSLSLISHSVTSNGIFLELEDNTSMRVDLSYELSGSGFSSSILEKATITNLGTDPTIYSFFKYADFDLCYGYNAHDNDYAFGDISDITQYDAFSIANITPVLSMPSAYQISECSYPGSIISSLDDNQITNLNDKEGFFGPGDATFAFQWDFTLGQNESYTIENMKRLTTAPEPVSSLLFVIGGASLAFLNRKKKKTC